MCRVPPSPHLGPPMLPLLVAQITSMYKIGGKYQKNVGGPCGRENQHVVRLLRKNK